MNGMIVSVTQFISYLALVVSSGVSAASIVGLYKPLADNNIDEINRILSATKRFYYRSGIAYVLLLVFLVVLYPMLVQNQIQPGITRFMIIILATSNLVDYLFLGKYKVLLMANQKGYVAMLVQTLGTVLNTIITVWLIMEGCNALLVKFVATVIYILRFILIWIYVRQTLQIPRFQRGAELQCYQSEMGGAAASDNRSHRKQHFSRRDDSFHGNESADRSQCVRCVQHDRKCDIASGRVVQQRTAVRIRRAAVQGRQESAR